MDFRGALGSYDFWFSTLSTWLAAQWLEVMSQYVYTNRDRTPTLLAGGSCNSSRMLTSIPSAYNRRVCAGQERCEHTLLAWGRHIRSTDDSQISLAGCPADAPTPQQRRPSSASSFLPTRHVGCHYNPCEFSEVDAHVELVMADVMATMNPYKECNVSRLWEEEVRARARGFICSFLGFAYTFYLVMGELCSFVGVTIAFTIRDAASQHAWMHVCTCNPRRCIRI